VSSAEQGFVVLAEGLIPADATAPMGSKAERKARLVSPL